MMSWLRFFMVGLPHAANAAQTAALKRTILAQVGGGGTLELEASQLAVFISTGGSMPQLDHSQFMRDEAIVEAVTTPVPADQRQDEETFRAMKEYRTELQQAKNKTLDATEAVQNRTQELDEQFQPVVDHLMFLVRGQTAEASQAERNVLKERMRRMHFTQVAALDRSANFWEQRIQREAELRRKVEANLAVERKAQEVLPPAVQRKAQELHKTRDVEKARLDVWLRNLGSRLAEAQRLVPEENQQASLIQLRSGMTQALKES